ncbi:MAG: hypothetical protein R3A52_20110 [Polyangiales bacterium]
MRGATAHRAAVPRACAYECEAYFADCDGDPPNGCEADTRTSSEHCGRCMNACALANASSACAMGACAVTACNAGFGDCDGNALNGCETDTRTAVSHRGACGNACAGAANAVPACVASACALTCTAGFADCDGRVDNGCEADTRVSVNHCGGCGRACNLANATSTCAGSVCAVGVQRGLRRLRRRPVERVRDRHPRVGDPLRRLRDDLRLRQRGRVVRRRARACSGPATRASA